MVHIHKTQDMTQKFSLFQMLFLLYFSSKPVFFADDAEIKRKIEDTNRSTAVFYSLNVIFIVFDIFSNGEWIVCS